MKRNVDIDMPPSVRTNTRSARIRPWLEYDLGLSPQRNFFGLLVDLLSPNLANTIPLHKTSIPDRTKISIRNDTDILPGQITSICNDADRFESRTSPHMIRGGSGLAALSFSGVGPVRLFLAPVSGR